MSKEKDGNSNPDPVAAPLIVIDLGADGGRIEIPTIDALRELPRKEDNAWEWVHQVPRTPNGFRQQIGAYSSALTQIIQPILNSPSARQQEHIPDTSRKLNEFFATAFMHSSGKRYAFIKRVRKDKGDSPAIFAAMFMLNLGGDTGWVRGAFDVISFERGLHDNEIEKTALGETQKEWNQFRQKVDIELAESKKQYVGLSGQMTDQLAAKGDAADKQRKEHAAAMASIEKKFVDDMAVKSAVEYWTAKEALHTNAAARFVRTAVWTGVVGAVIADIVICCSPSPVESVQTLLDSGRLDEKSISSVLTATWVSNVSRLAVVLLLFVWPVRILVRNYLSNVHLATDAGERRVIIQTYLAMLVDPDLKAHEDLKKRVLPHALKHIFRHSPTGIVSDAMPTPGILGLLKAGKGE